MVDSLERGLAGLAHWRGQLEMRIAVWHNLPSGGGKRALHDHVRGLVARGHEVEIWCPPSANRDYLPLGDIAREHVVAMAPAGSSRRGLASRVAGALLGARRDLRALDEHCSRCAEEIARGGFDLLLAHSSGTVVAVAPIARHVDLPRVLYLQEPQRELYEARPDWPWIPPRLDALPSPGALVAYARRRVRLAALGELAREEACNIAAYDRVLVNSFFSRETILRAFGLDARTCYLGIDTAKFRSSEAPREDFIVGLGAFTPAKNIELAIRAVGYLAAPRPRLVWIGNSSNREYHASLVHLAASLDVPFEPRTLISDSELVALLGRASMMVYSPRLEPFGFAPLEANACGTPVVAVAEGGVRETVVDGTNGLLADGGPEQLARAIERVRGDASFARSLGIAGRRLVEERWTLEAAVDRLEAHLAEVLRTRRSSLGVGERADERRMP